jgi:glycosyltransferase involved in cell wall biosynthesis
MAIALITNYLAPYRTPLYERLAERHELEVLCYGGGERYVSPWLTDLDHQLAAASFPARRLRGLPEALTIGRRYDAVIAPFAGGALLPAAYAGTRMGRRRFILWASVWAQPRSAAHLVALPATRHIYRHADSVLAYGEHVRRFVARMRGREDDVFVAPQSVELELFARTVSPAEITDFRERHAIPAGPLVLYAGRLVAEKGIEVLLDAWAGANSPGTLILIGDGPLADRGRAAPRTRLLGSMPREELPVAYAASDLAVLAAIPTPRFQEPWGLVCNEAMHQSRPVVASSTVGAVAGGLVRNGETGLVVGPGDVPALRHAIERLLSDGALRTRLGEAGRAAVSPYTYDAMVEAVEHALRAAGVNG